MQKKKSFTNFLNKIKFRSTRISSEGNTTGQETIHGTRTWKIPQSTNVAKNIQKSKLSVGVHA